MFTDIAKALPKESVNKKRGNVNIKKKTDEGSGGYCGC